MARRIAYVAALLLLAVLVIGMVSIGSELRAGASMARTREIVSVAGRNYSLSSSGVVEAELVEDGRRILLVPQAKEVLVMDGSRVQALAPACQYESGKFTALNGTRGKRVWLFAVVAEEKPAVRVVRPRVTDCMPLVR